MTNKGKRKGYKRHMIALPFGSNVGQHKVSNGFHIIVLEQLETILSAQQRYNSQVSIFSCPFSQALSRYFKEISDSRPSTNAVPLHIYNKDIN